MSTILLACSMLFAKPYLVTCFLYFLPFIVITPVLCIVLALFFEKVKSIEKLLTWTGAMSLELYMCHPYVLKLFDVFTDSFGTPFAIILYFLLSTILAILLYLINKCCLQRIFFVGF